jgi:class 3 adenylate cyclase/tetratricopeptide (TPR) repeat protein
MGDVGFRRPKMKCPRCQTENPEIRKFCKECGAKLILVCPHCHFDNLPLDKFCGECGHKLEEAVIGRIELQIEGERKQVTVLFSDLSGYTAMTERLDPEEVKKIIGQIFGQVAQVVTKYEGQLEKFIGDAVMAVFGIPKAHEDDPLRAIWAAREIHEKVETIGSQLKEKVGQLLRMHTGINTGLVVTGEAILEKGTLGVAGDTVNIASRLSSLAKAGVILVGQDTYLQTQGYFEFERQEPTRVKGKTEAVAIYKIIQPKIRVERPRRLAVQGISSPLVGRDAEFVALKGCLNRLLDGQGGIVCIIGEAGIGKSRLMAEIRNYIRNTQAISSLQWLEGRTLSYGQKISYWPFQEIIRHYTEITEEDSEAEAWQKLENRVSSLFAEETGEILPYLSTLLGLDVKGEYAEGVKYLDGKSMGSQIYLTSRRFFEHLARVQPLVLVFEDLHWVDESSMLLLEHLLPLVVRVPLLICGISRTDPKIPIERIREIATRDYERRYTELRLSPLSQSDSLQMMRNLMEIDNLSSTMREKIVHKVDGNPFFLEEIMRSLIDTGAVAYDSATERWKTTEKINTFTIPDTIQGVIMARVDRLGEEIKQVLKTAAVIGRSFLYRILKTIAEEVRELDRDLDQLQTVELIRVKQKVPELEYIFKHALVQEATYGSILLQRRRELHSKVGQAIEVLFPDRLEEFYSLLAYHYARAENWEKAQEYLFKAGDQAGKIAADTEALVHYQEAIETYTRVFGDKWNPIQRGILERKMGEAFYRRGETQKAMEYLQHALVYLGRPKLPESRLRVRLSILREIAVQIAHHIFSRWLIKKTYGPVDQAVEETARIYEIVASKEAVEGAPEHFLLTTLTCLNFSERNGYITGIITESSSLVFIAYLLSFSGLAEFFLQRVVALSGQTQHPAALLRLHLNLTISRQLTGQLDEAVEYGLKGAAIARGSGYWHPFLWASANFFAGMACILQGSFDRALAIAEEVIRFGQDSNDPAILCFGLSGLGSIQGLRGDFEESVANLERAIELGEATQSHLIRVFAGSQLGRCYFRLGDLERSIALLTQANNYRATHRVKGWEYEVPIEFFRTYLSVAERNVYGEKEKYLRKAKQACKEVLRSARVYRFILPETMMLQGRYEWIRGKPWLAEKWWQKSLKIAEEMGMRHELGMTHLEMGRRLKDRAHLEKAETIFADIGADFDLAHTRKLLEAGST